MDDGKQVLIDALTKHHSEAMAKAKEFREIAKRQTMQAESDLYLQQAWEQEAKARGYLKHAEMLKEMEDSEDPRRGVATLSASQAGRGLRSSIELLSPDLKQPE